jgi:hypothetical protein
VKSLTPGQVMVKLNLINVIIKRQAFLDAVITEYNEKLGKANEKVQKAIDALNESIADAESWREAVFTDMEDYASERSEKWHESESGQKFLDWKETFEGEFQPVEIDLPDDVEMPDADDVAELLEQLTDSPEEL